MSVNPRINITTINSIETKTACFNGVRYYDPSLQRFLGEDPIGFSSEDFNFYRYVTSDPINFIDPSGENWVKVAIVVAGVTVKYVWKWAGKGAKPRGKPKKSPIKPDKRKGVWNCAVVACCNDNIPGNCPDKPSQQCKQGIWRDTNRANAIRVAEALAKQRLGCQAKHVTVKCTGPKGESWTRGG